MNSENKTKKIIGLNISDYSLEVVVVVNEEGVYKISLKQRILFDAGVVASGKAIDQPVLAKLLKTVFEELENVNPQEDEIVFGLPESLVYLSVFYSNSSDDIQIKIRNEVENNIPVAPEKVDVSTKVFHNKKEGIYRTVLAAIKKEDNLEWQQFFKALKYNVIFYDIEVLANFRGFLNEYPQKPVIILDIGAMSANLSAYNRNGLVYSYGIPYAGDYFSDKLAKALKMDWEEAEELKQEFGLNQTKNKEAGVILRSAMEHYVIEIERNIKYFHEKISPQDKVDLLYLIGGTGLMLGLKEFLEERLRIKIIDFVKEERNLLYKNAYGLALKGWQKKWQERDPDFKKQKKTHSLTLIKTSLINDKTQEKIKIVSAFVLALIAVFVSFKIIISNQSIAQPEINQAVVEQVASSTKTMLPATSTIAKVEKEYAVIKDFGSNLNLRNGPGTTYEIIGFGEAKKEFLIIEKTDTWVKIEYNEGEAWAYRQYIDIETRLE